MNELAKIKEICKETDCCKFCILHDETDTACPISGRTPDLWVIDKILKNIKKYKQ